MSELVTVVIADDHPVFRGGLRTLLSSTGEFDVVGEASTGAEAIELAADLVPDVVIMDVQMPGGVNGIEATRRITERTPGVQVLVLTMFDDDESVFSAMRGGATGYVLKDTEQADVLHAIHTVASGGAVFGASIAGRVRAYFAGEAPTGSPFPELTQREVEILDLIAAGQNNTAIAQRLGIAVKTVRNSASNIFLKLHAADRAEVIIRAREAGLGRQG